MVKAVEAKKDGDEEISVEEVIKDVARYEKNFSKLGHVEGKILGTGYLFPLVRKLLELFEYHEAYLSGLDDACERLALGFDVLNEAEGALTEAGETLTKLAALLDEVCVHAGFFTVVKGVGLKVEPKCPPAVKAQYEVLSNDVREVMEQVTDALESIAQVRAQADGGDDDDDEGPELVSEPSPESAAESAAAAVVAEATADANAQEKNGENHGA